MRTLKSGHEPTTGHGGMRDSGNLRAPSRVAPDCVAFSISRPHFPRNIGLGQEPGWMRHLTKARDWGAIDSLESRAWSRVSPGRDAGGANTMSEEGVTA